MLTTLIIPLLLLNQGEPVKKTDSEILKMGREKWSEYYSENIGYSTASMSNAEALYGKALYRANSAKLPKSPKTVQTLVKKVRPLLTSLRVSSIEVASGFSGGGTMWNPVYAGVQADVEECIANILANKSSRKRVVSDVTKPLDQMFVDIRKHRDDLDLMSLDQNGFKVTLKSAGQVKSSFQEIVKLAKTTPRSHSDALLGFCESGVKLYLSVKD